ncbi:MAG: hypothetical protein ACLQVM_06715 [Terriglobia bacterium]
MDLTDAPNLVEKIALLERCVGQATGYVNLDPIPLDQHDILQIQAEARRIRDFVQLKDLTFVVGFAKQQDGVLGNVELKYGQECVFIEIAPESIEFPGAVSAVLAHEICHKYMHRHGLSNCSHPTASADEEILTDVAAVFLGLGKLMLNGCDSQKTREDLLLDGTKRSTTTTYRAGYLDPAQFAFVYRFVCAMREVPEAEIRRGLSGDALSRLLHCERSLPEWFQTRCHSRDFLLQVLGSLQAEIRGAQVEMATLDRCLLYLERGCLGPLEAWSRGSHRKLNQARRAALKAEEQPECDPCLAYIRAAELNQMVSDVIELKREAGSCQLSLIRLQRIVELV